MQVYRMKFLSALHIDSRGSGEPDVAEEFIHSDTLSAALCLGWAALHPDVDDRFFLDPPFRVSSAFPYVGRTLLFPVPVWPIWEGLDVEERKRVKKIRWLSQGLLAQVLAGRMLSLSGIEELPGGVAVGKAEFKADTGFAKGRPWAMGEMQRVSVDRLGIPRQGGLFFFGLQYFAPFSGLFFLAEASQKDRQNLRAAMDYLGDTGIGADRNCGLGHFRVDSDEKVRIDEAPGAGGWYTLSLFNPSTTEDLEDLTASCAYGLTTRSGWITESTVGRPPVRAFTEGSYFGERPVGRVAPLIDEKTRERFHLPISHAVLRDFRALCLPCVRPACLKEVQK